VKLSKARQRSVELRRFSPNFKQMCSKTGLTNRGFGLIKRFFTTGINGVIPDWTLLGLYAGGLMNRGFNSGDYCINVWQHIYVWTTRFVNETQSKLRTQLNDEHLQDVMLLASSNLPPKRLWNEKQHRFCHINIVLQGRNEVRWRPGQEASLAPPCSNLRFFESKCTILKRKYLWLCWDFSVPQ